MADLVNNVTTLYSVSGLEDSLSRIERITAAEQRLAAQSTGLSTATAGLDRSTLSAARGLDAFTRGLDPLSRAMAAYERGLSLANRTLAQGGTLTEENNRALAAAKARVDELSSALNDNASAADRAAAAQQRLLDQQDREARNQARAQQIVGRATVAPDRGADIAAYGTELDRLRAKYSPLFSLQQEYRSSLTEINQAARVGALTEAERAAALARTKSVFADNVRGLKEGTEHAKGMSSGAMELEHAFRSMAGVVAAGGSPLMAFEVEAGRLIQVTGSDGGLSGALGGLIDRFKSVGSSIAEGAETALGLINPWTLAATAVVGFGAAAVTAVVHVRSLREEMDRAVLGAGHFAGLSGDALGSLAFGSAARTGVGLADSRTIAAGLASSGRFDVGNISGIMGLTRGYAGATGLSNADAGAKLTEILSDPLKGIDQLNERFGFLSDRTRETVKSLMAQGDAQGALRVATDAAATSINEMAKPQGPLDKFMEFWGKRNAEIEESISNLSKAPNPLQRYQSGETLTLDGDDASFANDAESIRQAGLLRELQRRNAVALPQSQGAGDIVRSTLPDFEARQKLVDQQTALSKALSNPDVLDKMGPAAEQAFDALDRLNTGLSNFKTTAQQAAEQSSLTIASINATTFAEKLAAEYQKNYAEALDRTHSALEAAAAAEQKRNEAIATANKQAEDAARQQRQSDALLGLRPLQRLQMERDQAIENARRESAVGPSASAGVVSSGNAGFDSAVRRTLGFEGGLNRRDTNGTPSNFGINAAANPGVDVGSLTAGSAAAIYKKNYWDAIGADSMSPQMARVAFDTAVMEGVGRTMKLITASGGDANKLLDMRQDFEGRLLTRDPAKYGPYAKAWASRDAGLRADIGGSVGATGGYVGGIPGAYTTAPTAYATRVGAANDSYAAQSRELVESTFRSANDNLTQQNAAQAIAERAAALDRYGDAAAVAAGKVAEMNERQKLMNELALAGVTDFSSLTPRINELAAQYGASAEAAARFEENQKRVIDAMDGLRSGFGDGLHTFIDDLIKGKSAGAAFRDVLAGIGQKLLNLGENMLTDSLFGKQGQAGGGAFGGFFGTLFSSLFHIGGGGGVGAPLNILPMHALGTDDAPGGPSIVGERGPEIVNLPRHAQVIPNNAIGRQPAGHTFHIGGPTINVQGDVSEQNRAMITQAVARGQQETIRQITRDLPIISAASQQYAA